MTDTANDYAELGREAIEDMRSKWRQNPAMPAYQRLIFDGICDLALQALPPQSPLGATGELLGRLLSTVHQLTAYHITKPETPDHEPVMVLNGILRELDDRFTAYALAAAPIDRPGADRAGDDTLHLMALAYEEGWHDHRERRPANTGKRNMERIRSLSTKESR